jgi:site-specific DNA recombinase
VKAIGYVRVSTEKQGLSREAQEKKIRSMAEVQGAELVDVIVDSESGKWLKRPGMARALKLIDKGQVQCLIIAKLDRLTRSVRDLANLLDRLQRCGVALVSVAESLDTNSAAGRLVINILGCVSQWEREAISERTRDALQHLKSSGKVYGAIPFGFTRRGSALVANSSEAAIIKRIRAWRRRGMTLRAIAERLNEESAARKRGGKKWYASTVGQILKNSLHAPRAKASR